MNAWLEWLVANDITASEVILNALLAILGVIVLVGVWRLHKGNGVYKNFNLVHLIVNADGFPDGAKVVEIGTFFLLAWGFIVYVTSKTLPEWYMQWFLIAFVLRGAYGAYLRSKGGPEMPGTTTVTQTAIKTTEVSPQVAPPAPPHGAPPQAPATNPNFAPPSSNIAAQDVNIKAAGEVTVEREPKGKK